MERYNKEGVSKDIKIIFELTKCKVSVDFVSEALLKSGLLGRLCLLGEFYSLGITHYNALP